MYVYKFKNDKKYNYVENSILIMGCFEIFHKGHEMLLENAIKNKGDKKIGIISFTNPETVFRKDKRKITDLQFNLDVFYQKKIDFVVVIDFDEEIRKIEGNLFLNTLIKKYGVTKFIFGKDYKVGYEGKWNSDLISKKFNSFVCEMKKEQGIKISTTKIKESLSLGLINSINLFLDYDYGAYFEIINSSLIFPPNFVKIHAGVYAVKILIDNKYYHAMLKIDLNNKTILTFLNYDDVLKEGFYKVLFCQLIRVIVSSILDKELNTDKENVLNYFLENKKTD